jgi:amino acid adenylation domain-containing protein
LNIVDCFLEDHTQPISQIDFLTEEERHHILIDLNQTEMINPVDQTIVQQFKAQVDRVPDKIALRVTSQVPECDDEEMELTYRELNERANQLARHLKLLGVEPETFVGIYMDRSIDMVVGLLGILKAGGAYVPLDPAFPEDRLAYMLADSQARVLLTQESLREHKFNHADLKQICLDSDWPVIAGQDVGNIFSEAEASNLAYVIYTSGSTGKPKGVEITNGSVINFLTSMRQEPGLGEDDVLLSVTTLSFDIAVLEIFLPLTTGACLFLVDRETAMNGQGLNKKLTSSRATVMQATPITWRMLIDSGWQGDHHLKILCGGEALPRALANQLLERCGSLWNMYGPTETTVWSTINRVERGGEAPSIGRPIANTQIYILDPYMRPVPIGVTGELYIGGEGLARGYHNQPQLTASKFLPNPFSGRDSARLYRTGDLACFMPDGKIEFFGRIDHQVKVRGFRIELDEIEGVLEQHPEIQQAVVVAQEDDTGNKRLVAYLLTVNGLCPSVSELRTYLKRILPDYMVPSAFMFLEAFPLTPNKKVNRRALPIPDTERPDLEVTYVAPKTELQRIIASIWQDVLSLERIGIDDDFFDLGGNSLLAMQVISRINKTLVIDLSVRDLFENPTLEGLAQRNTEAQEDQEDKEPGTKKKRREIIL